MRADDGLRGKVALVTGAAGGGCGSATALALAEAGATVVANGLPRHAEALRRLATGRPALCPAVADVSAENEVDALVRGVVAEHGRLDIVVHNAAGSLPAVGVDGLTTGAWRAELATILDGAFFLSRAAAPAMRGTGGGRIIYISSSAAFRGTGGRSAAYAAAKAGLHGLVVQLALELGADAITVNAVAPSQIDTPRVRRGGRRDDESLRRYAHSLPLRRVGTADDLAGLVCFLASAASGYLTGQVLRLDGGSALASVQTRTNTEGCAS
jgi:3-oxoacyl-[acyl-carrier protein] reductase